MTPAEHKTATLKHCLRIAKVDPEYAIWAAAEYERMEPWLLENLQAKVRQAVKRAERERADAAPVS